ncbi:hypothetical protein DEW08_28655 (plasmid) [Azospirillum thermophilum]|uniref:Uncharacterized protein n=1 Tax=Azospirillum thermophilum TaxID=2202148 RepID=A0A2S2CZP6_9PROT|nr:hypothetical protein DEW08_28655 [Azospirillum thermophilum]
MALFRTFGMPDGAPFPLTQAVVVPFPALDADIRGARTHRADGRQDAGRGCAAVIQLKDRRRIG